MRRVNACRDRVASRLMVVLMLAAMLAGAGVVKADEPALAIAKQGSFFVGGQSQAVSPGNDITVNQMYVQYQVPASIESQPEPAIVLIHGCCLSAKSWDETPDGRMGWSEYFVRKGYPTYLIDQVTRARSGFDPTVFQQVRSGAAPATELPRYLWPPKQGAPWHGDDRARWFVYHRKSIDGTVEPVSNR